MLGNLKISNYALIDNSEIAFEKGLNIITGETGAGKSILLGALGLLMGQRAETQVLFDKDKKCVVEEL
jgi:DNA repair protein RecN (Recombination protein N)